MRSNTNSFLLVGNSTYLNRGCEAIVRGTVEILAAAAAPASPSFTNGFYGDADAVRWQTAGETDQRISHLGLTAYPRKWTREWAEDRLNRRTGTGFPSVHRRLMAPAAAADGVLEVGGDNYTLDYGFPEHLISMDRWLMGRGKSVVIWGASIGPFTEYPVQEARIMDHFRSLRAVFVRESETFDYLANIHGLKNVRQFADPAFAMTPCEPVDAGVRALVEDSPIAVNISPLLAAYRGVRRMAWEIGTDDLRGWVEESAEIVRRLHRQTGQPILLLPHVGSSLPGLDDWGFLAAVHHAVAPRVGSVQSSDPSFSDFGNGLSSAQRVPIRLLSAQLNARELKWVISRCRALVAARTHATIAAFSTGVPTVSLGYSRKAQGINNDVFDTTEFCVKSSDLSVEGLISVVQRVLREEDAIRKHLAVRGPELKASAMAAGPALIELLQTN